MLRGESEALAEAVPRNAQEEVDARTEFFEVVPRVVCLVSAFLRTVARYRDLWKGSGVSRRCSDGLHGKRTLRYSPSPIPPAVYWNQGSLILIPFWPLTFVLEKGLRRALMASALKWRFNPSTPGSSEWIP